MNPSSPAPTSFCRVLKHDGGCFVYDAGSARVLKVDPVLADVLPLWGPCDERTVVRRLGRHHDPQAVTEAIAEIRAARRDEGLFLTDRPRGIAPCPACHDPAAWDSRLGHLTLTISEQCNLRCRYCLHGAGRSWVRPHRERAMPLATALAALTFFAERCAGADAPTVSFYGGEPLLQLGLIRAVIAAADARPDWPELRFLIDTNGTLLDDDAVALIADRGLYLQISLDGPPRLHDRHRRGSDGEPTCDRILAGVRRLLRRDPGAAARIRFVTTLAPPYALAARGRFFADFRPFLDCGVTAAPQLTVNFADLDGIDPAALGLGPEADGAGAARARCLSRARRRYVDACASGPHEAVDPVLRALFDKELITFHHRSRDPLPPVVSPQGCCLPGQRRLHVRADGALQPCERLGESLVIGHATRGIDREAVAGLFERFIAAVGDRCRDCWAVRLCDLCFAALAPADGCLPAGARGQDGQRRGRAAGVPGAPEVPELQGVPEVPAAACAQVRRRCERTLRLHLTLMQRGSDSLAYLRQSLIG